MVGYKAAAYRLQGGNYEGSLRCLTLAVSALKRILLNHATVEEQAAIDAAQKLFSELMANEKEQPLRLDPENEVIKRMDMAIDAIKQRLVKQGPVSQLFLMLIEIHDILIMNLNSERLSDWNMYVQSLRLMLPYLAAAGHHNYTKSIVWFLQQIDDMDPVLFRSRSRRGILL